MSLSANAPDALQPDKTNGQHFSQTSQLSAYELTAVWIFSIEDDANDVMHLSHSNLRTEECQGQHLCVLFTLEVIHTTKVPIKSKPASSHL